MNSIFQILLGIDEIRDFFKSLDFSESSESLLSHFHSFLQSYQSPQNLVIPKHLVETSFSLFPASKPYTQQDAQEYFYLLIDKLNTELSLKEEVKVFEDLFQGEIITSIKCKQGKKTIREEFLQMNLSIQSIDAETKNKRTQEELEFIEQRKNSLFCKIFRNKDVYTVVDFVRQYMSNNEKTLQETCILCEEKNSCMKKMKFSKAPKYLIICLKRFSYFKKFSKLTTKVFAVESFKVSGNQYELMAIVEHQSFLGRRHYKVFCKDKEDWLECNDSKVKKAKLEKVQNSEPYILVYKQSSLDSTRLESAPLHVIPDNNEAVSNNVSNRSSQIHISIGSSHRSRSSLKIDSSEYVSYRDSKTSLSIIPSLTTHEVPPLDIGYKTHS